MGLSRCLQAGCRRGVICRCRMLMYIPCRVRSRHCCRCNRVASRYPRRLPSTGGRGVHGVVVRDRGYPGQRHRARPMPAAVADTAVGPGSGPVARTDPTLRRAACAGRSSRSVTAVTGCVPRHREGVAVTWQEACYLPGFFTDGDRWVFRTDCREITKVYHSVTFGRGDHPRPPCRPRPVGRLDSPAVALPGRVCVSI